MTPDRLQTLTPVEVEQQKPLVIRRGEEFFPFADVVIYIPENHFSDRASQQFVLQDEDYGELTGRFFFRKPFAFGNASVDLGFLPQRFYTLAREEDDLTQMHETYPGQPRERLEFSFGVDIPGTTDAVSHVTFGNDFRETTRLKVTNHITDKSFYAAEKKTHIGWSDTQCTYEGKHTLVYDQFYYEGQEPTNRHQYEAGLGRLRGKDTQERTAALLADIRKPIEERIEERRADDEINRQRSFNSPFHLAFVKLPRVMEKIGITLEKVPNGSIDLSVSRADEKPHSH